MPDVSVIIVNWNTRELLLACIRSIRQHTGSVSLEIIVVDNASSDGSQEALLKAFPDVVLIQNAENLGFARANNIGIKAAQGDYLCLVNSDVEVKPQCLDRMKAYMDSNPDIGIMGPKIYYPNGTVQDSCKKFPSLWNRFCMATFLHKLMPGFKVFASSDTWYDSYDKIHDVDAIIGAFWCVRRTALAAVGLLDEQFYFYAEDIDWCKRFWVNNYKVVFFPEAEIIHHTGGSSTHAPVKYYIQLNRAVLQYWEKHHGTRTLGVFKAIMALHQLMRILFNAPAYIIKRKQKNIFGHKIERSVACLLWLVKKEEKSHNILTVG